MHKLVKPALPGASIPDPVRQRDLPPEGYPVEWSVHWIRLEARGDIIAEEIPDAPPAALEELPPAAEAPAAPSAEPAEGEELHPDA